MADYPLDHGRGYAAVPRDARTFEPLLADHTAFTLWTLLHLHARSTAGWVNQNGSDMWLEAGQSALTITKLSERLGIDRKTVRRKLSKLEKCGLIAWNGDSRGTVETLCCYGEYGTSSDEGAQQKGQHQGQQIPQHQGQQIPQHQGQHQGQQKGQHQGHEGTVRTGGTGNGRTDLLSADVVVSPPPAKPKPDAKTAIATALVATLASLSGRRIDPTAQGNHTHVRARLTEGATPAQLELVIAHKCAAWRTDGKMKTYLRPQTLFQRSKWPDYLLAATEWDSAGRPSIAGRDTTPANGTGSAAHDAAEYARELRAAEETRCE